MLGQGDQDLVDRLVVEHRTAAETTAELTSQAGGEPYECANVWYSERASCRHMKLAILGDEADLPGSDDPGTDMMRMSYGFETMVSSMYQGMIELVTDLALRVELGQLGTVAGRHSAAVAIAVTGAPDGYISPVVLGGELTPDESGRAELFAIPARFGSLASTEIVIGAAQRIRHPFQLRSGDAGRELLRLRRADLHVLTHHPIWVVTVSPPHLGGRGLEFETRSAQFTPRRLECRR